MTEFLVGLAAELILTRISGSWDLVFRIQSLLTEILMTEFLVGLAAELILTSISGSWDLVFRDSIPIG